MMLVGHAARKHATSLWASRDFVSVQGLVVMMAFLAVVASEEYGLRVFEGPQRGDEVRKRVRRVVRGVLPGSNCHCVYDDCDVGDDDDSGSSSSINDDECARTYVLVVLRSGIHTAPVRDAE